MPKEKKPTKADLDRAFTKLRMEMQQIVNDIDEMNFGSAKARLLGMERLQTWEVEGLAAKLIIGTGLRRR